MHHLLLAMFLNFAPIAAALAANEAQPHQNVDKRNDAGNDTGNSRVDKLNDAQSDKNQGVAAPAR